MSKILHVVHYFDPSFDVLRCVRELRLYSKHEHKMWVRDEHPYQKFFQFDYEPNVEPLEDLLSWCDAILFQFKGCESGLDNINKPAAFRNINIYWNQNTNKFWSHPLYNAETFDRYKLVSSSHVGAKDFLPADRFRWLPDLIPMDGLYTPDYSPKSPRVSFIKHNEELTKIDFGFPFSNHVSRPHGEIMKERRSTATICVDNICDGHFGLSGLETMAMGIPTVVFNHLKTREALKCSFEEYPPFLECLPIINSVVEIVKNNKENRELGIASRNWMEKYYAPSRIIKQFWDPFFDELLGG